jgi:hypothetical protein
MTSYTLKLVEELYAVPETGADPDLIREVANTLYQQHLIIAGFVVVCKELLESAEYWSEYDVPLGIVDRLRLAVSNEKRWRAGND